MENPHQTWTGERPTAQFEVLAPLISRCLKELSNTQTLLSSTRKELLVERERVKTAGREVRQKRIDAGNAEATFMNCVREFANNYLEQFPTTLFDAYDKVMRKRDELGVAEENYLQTEGSLTGAEWTFITREDRFYQFDVNRMFLDLHLDGAAHLYSQPIKTLSHPPIHQLPPCPAGALSPSQVSKLPPPPPPPLSSAYSSAAPFVEIAPFPLTPNGRENAAIMAEMNTLKRELSQLWQEEAYDSAWALGDGALFAEGDEIPEVDVTACRSEQSDNLFEVPHAEANVKRCNVGDVDQALDASILTRRFSDPAYSSRVASRLSVPMMRIQIESAVSYNRCDLATTKKIGEWSLAHLKVSVIQRCLYLNALEDYGVASFVRNNWEVHATNSWSKDGLTYSGDNNELYVGSASETGYETQSYQDRSVTESITSSLLMQHRLEGNLQPSKETAVDLNIREVSEILGQSHEDVSQTASPSPDDQIADKAENNNGDRTTNPVADVLDQQRYSAQAKFPAETVVDQLKCTCLEDCGDAALRKDSVQSTHHPKCMITTNHDHLIIAYRSMRKQNDALFTTKVTTLDEHYDSMHQSPPVVLNVPHPSTSNHGTSKPILPDFDITAHSASPYPYAQLPTLPAPINKGNLRSTQSATTADCRPISQRRRLSMSWVKSVIHPFKYLRSKSTPSIR